MPRDKAVKTREGTPGKEPSPQGRERLIDAAVRLFGRDGFETTSLREVAKEAGVSWGLIRFYFGSKEGLQAAAEEKVVSTYLDSAVAGSSASTSERLDELIEEYGSVLPEVARFLRRAIVEQRPVALEFIRRLMAGENIYTRLQADFPEEEWLSDPIRMVAPRLGNLLVAPQFEQLLGRDIFSTDELRRRNTDTSRMIELVRLGLETERRNAKG